MRTSQSLKLLLPIFVPILGQLLVVIYPDELIYLSFLNLGVGILGAHFSARAVVSSQELTTKVMLAAAVICITAPLVYYCLVGFG